MLLLRKKELIESKPPLNNLPLLSAKKCLEIAKISISDVDHVAWAWDCNDYSKIIHNKNLNLSQFSREYKFNNYFKFLHDPKLIEEEFNIFFEKKNF